MKKDDRITLQIEDYDQEGSGIGHFEGMAVFVKDTVIGDRVLAKVMTVKKRLAFARAEKILEPSPQRTQARCPLARPCGGCQLQMMDYAAQLRFKENKVRSALIRIGGFSEETADSVLEPCIGMENPWRYRNKAQFPVGTDRSGRPRAGFYAGRTHDIIETGDCLIGIEENRQIVETVLGHMRREHIPAYDEKTGQGTVRHIFIRKGFHTGQIMTVVVINGSELKGEKELAQQLLRIPGMTSVGINVNDRRTNVIFGEKTRMICGPEAIEDTIGQVRYRISPQSFYQVNPVQTKKLYDTVMEFAALTGKETVWDLYCGIGTISLFLARKAKQVYGVEIVPQAVEDARENARQNGIENAFFYAGKAEEAAAELAGRGIGADVVVVDPPRKGCEESLLETMARLSPSRIVYVSCDPATLARDLRYLSGRGYEAVRIRPCDMFCHSVHIETIVLLQKLNS